jgi:predicted Zn-dependent protease
VAGFAVGMVDQFAVQAVTSLLTQGYGPDKEREADKLGTDLAAKAGYDPAGLRNFLANIAEAASNPANKQATALYNGKTHPPLKDRVSKLSAITGTYPAGGQVLASRYKQSVNFETDNGRAPAASASAKKTGKKSSSGK